MVDAVNSTVLMANATLPFFETVRTVIGTASYVLGGFFGLYLIWLVFRWWQNRLIIRLLRDIKFDLDQQNKRLGIPCSKELLKTKVLRISKEYLKKKKHEKRNKKRRL